MGLGHVIIPVFAWIIIGVTAALLAGSAIIRARFRPPPHVVLGDPGPAPWEREGGTDLTAPSKPMPTLPPVGARLRPADPNASLTPALLADITRGLQKIPPFPQALIRILKELEAARSSAKTVAQVVASEPVLTASLLRVANSAAFGVRHEIVTAADAVAYLGFSTVKMLLIKLKVGGLFRQTASSGCYDSEKLWVHSMAVAQVAEELARRAGGTDPHLALTVGLLHDIGKVAINSQFPDTVRELWKRGGPADESFLARERRLFGADHAFIGGYLAANWKLPDDLIQSIRVHHLPSQEAVVLRPEARRALFCVYIANQLVKYSHVYCEDMEIDIIPLEVMTELGMPVRTEELLDDSMRQIIARTALLEGEPQRTAPKAAAA